MKVRCRHLISLCAGRSAFTANLWITPAHSQHSLLASRDMRWDNLFDDLEGQFEKECGAMSHHEALDEERQRQGRLVMQERLRNLTPLDAGGRQQTPVDVLAVTLTSGIELGLVLLRHGRDWCAVEISTPRGLSGQALLPITAIASVSMSPDQLRASLGRPGVEVPPSPGIADRIGLSFVLRDLCRRRSTVEVHHCGATFHGTLDRVSDDHCELAIHAVDVPRRNAHVRQVLLMAMSHITMVRVL